MKRSAAILTATIGLLALTSACTPAEVRHYIKASHVRPATETVVEIGTPLAPLAPSIDSGCLSGQDCTPVGQPVPTTIAAAPGEPPCEDGQPAGTCNYPVGYQPPVTVPDTTPAPVCGGNVTGECN